jgi:hypothetical protein
MIVIVGFVVCLVAVIVGFIGCRDAGPDRPLTDNNGDRARRRARVGTDTAVDTVGPQSRPETTENEGIRNDDR